MIASPYRAGSPLTRPGPRVKVCTSAAGRTNVTRIAGEMGLTQRIVLDALLEDERLVRIAAARARAQIKPKPIRGTGPRR